MPGPFSVCPPRSSTTLSTWITNASPVQVMSLARTKSPVICVLQAASRGGIAREGALVPVGIATGAGVAAGEPDAAELAVVVPAGASGWQAAARIGSARGAAARGGIPRLLQRAAPAGFRCGAPAPRREAGTGGRAGL